MSDYGSGTQSQGASNTEFQCSSSFIIREPNKTKTFSNPLVETWQVGPAVQGDCGCSFQALSDHTLSLCVAGSLLIRARRSHVMVTGVLGQTGKCH